MNTLQLSTAHPEAFKALPEAYQNDDVLEFYILQDTGELLSRPLKDQITALGDWIAIYDSGSRSWSDYAWNGCYG